MEMLKELQKGGMKSIDLDKTLLPPYIKRRITVIRCSEFCPVRPVCRYMKFQEKCLQNNRDFQISNHNYLMADIMRQSQGEKPLIPGYGILVADEAHKIMETARQMYKVTLDEITIERLMDRWDQRCGLN